MDDSATNRVLSWASLAIAVLALAEVIGMFTVGLAVNVKRMSFPIRQGYAFLTDLEKSPIGLALIAAAVLAAIAVARRDDEESANVTRAALWVIVGVSAILGIATILAVLARFRVGEIAPDQRVDSITRRVLVVFVIRNFGSAIVAILIALSSLFRGNPTAVTATDAVDATPAVD
jgi:hypothetical protein